MKSSDVYRIICQELAAVYDYGEAKALARVIVEDFLKIPFSSILAGLAPEIAKEHEQELNRVIQRLLRHEPIQYILGKTQFCGLEMEVNPSVLIPRPETEGLVDIVSERFGEEQDFHVLDACTGSGCIAITLKHRHPKWRVEALDISLDALETAYRNAEKNNAEITFRQQDILASTDNLAQTDLLPLGGAQRGALNLIVSNPPYVTEKEKCAIEPNVLDFEPHLALFVKDNDPLIFYRVLGRLGQAALKARGHLAVEINTALAKEVVDLFLSMGYETAEILKDCFGKDRFVLCRK